MKLCLPSNNVKVARAEAFIRTGPTSPKGGKGRGRKLALAHREGAESTAMGNEVLTSRLVSIFLLIFIYFNSVHIFVLFACIVCKIYEHLSTCLLFGMTSCTFCWGRRHCYKNDRKQTFVRQREKGPASSPKLMVNQLTRKRKKVYR